MASLEKAYLVLFMLSLVISSVHLYALDEVMSEDGKLWSNFLKYRKYLNISEMSKHSDKIS